MAASNVGQPVRIGINAVAVQEGGGVSYVRGILPHLAAADGRAQAIVYARSEFLQPLYPGVEVRVVPHRNLLARTVWEQLLLPGLLRREEIDVLFAPGNQGPVLRHANFVVLVQNVDPLVPPWSGTPLSFRAKMIALRSAMLASARRARAVVTVSAYVRSLLAAQTGLPPDAIEVIPHGAPADAQAAPSPFALEQIKTWGLAGDEPFVLALSNVTYNKNYPTLIRAFARARRAVGFPLRLAIAGRVMHPWCMPEIHRALAESGISDSVQWLGWVDGEVRRALFAQAAALLFCSRVESFGLPALEAMAYGVPVVASDISPVQEVCADAAVYAHPDDPDAIAERLVQVLTDGALRRRLTDAGRGRASRYSWQDAARQTLRILRHAAGVL